MRAFLFQFLVLISLSGLKAQSTLDQGLLLHYKLDGSAEDFSLNNFDGIPNVSFASDYMGNALNAAVFNGTGNYIDFPNSSELKPSLPISIAFRVKFNFPNGVNTWVLSTNYSTDAYRGVFVNTGNGKIALSYGDGTIGVTSPSNRRTKTGAKPLNAGEWYYVVGVIRGATDMDIYVDCTNDGGVYAGSGGTMSYDNNPGSIGRGDVAGFNPYYLNGSLDDFRYWNRALSAQEVSELCSLIATNNNLAHETLGLDVYPNPFSNNFQVAFNRTKSAGLVKALISDASGRIVLQKDFVLDTDSQQIDFDLSAFESGFYFLSLSSSNESIVRKIIKR